MKTLTIVAMLTLTIGCGPRALTPKSLPVDRAECARCGMLISSDATGGQIVSADGTVRFYDDIGCLGADADVIGAQSRAFVRTADGAWAEATAASFARSAAARTPMGSGILAFPTGQAPLTWSDVVRESRSGDGVRAAVGGGVAPRLREGSDSHIEKFLEKPGVQSRVDPRVE